MSKNSKESKFDHVLQRIGELNARLGQIEELLKQSHDADVINPRAKEAERDQAGLQSTKRTKKAKLVLILLSPFRTPLSRYLLTALTTILALVTGYVDLRYDISIAPPYASLDPSAPFESRFLVTNTSPFSINDVSYFCLSVHVRIGGGREISNGTYVPITIGPLRSHGGYSVRCGIPLGDLHINPGAVLEIHVIYSPKFMPWVHKQGGQQFVLKYDKQENAVWIPTAYLSKNLHELEQYSINP